MKYQCIQCHLKWPKERPCVLEVCDSVGEPEDCPYSACDLPEPMWEPLDSYE